MESHLARLGLGELLVETTGGTILKDTDTATGTDDEKKEKERLRKANRKAAGILLNSISIDTKDGQADFQLIEKWHNAKDGYVGGHKEWEALIERHEELKSKTVHKLKEEYWTAR